MIIEDPEIVQVFAQFTENDRTRHVRLHLDVTPQVLYHGGAELFSEAHYLSAHRGFPLGPF